MNKGLWISRKNHLCILIKKVSDGFGGDDIEFVRQHCKEVLEVHQDEKIEEAIDCYKKIVNSLELYEFNRS